MPETISTAAGIYKELGALAFLIICGAIAFAWMVWRIVKTQDKISDRLDSISDRQATHDQRALDMHMTCKEHGMAIATLAKEVGGLSADVRVLQEKVN